MANIVRWEPFREALTLRDAMDRLFAESFVRPFGGWDGEMLGEFQPLPVDVIENKDEVIVKATVPGLKAEDIQVNVTADVLSIKGETKSESEVKDANYVRRERRYGSFARRLTLPTTVVTDKAKAEFEDGVLTLTLPKADEVKPKTIQIKKK
ncbi:MAG: Hsp20/alpha crystallin family protein [Chloroflexi bacterium]|nr:Hsp20/alpha crystallin family protein [Chloroflexota bacterium]